MGSYLPDMEDAPGDKDGRGGRDVTADRYFKILVFVLLGCCGMGVVES